MAAGLVTVVTAASANMPICFMNILHCRLNIVTLRPYSYDNPHGGVAGLSWPLTGSHFQQLPDLTVSSSGPWLHELEEVEGF